MISMYWQITDITSCGCSLLPQRRDTVWVVSFRPKSANSTSGGYDGLNLQQPPDMQSFLNASEAIIFWGGLHHNVKEVQICPGGHIWPTCKNL
jgi:hypothetical protein